MRLCITCNTKITDPAQPVATVDYLFQNAPIATRLQHFVTGLMNRKPNETHEPLHDRTPGLQRELLQIRSDVNAALEPVEDWYDVHGNEGPKRTIREILDDVVGDLVDDREQVLAMRAVCREIVDEAKFSSDGRTGRVADELIAKLESLLG